MHFILMTTYVCIKKHKCNNKDRVSSMIVWKRNTCEGTPHVYTCPDYLKNY